MRLSAAAGRSRQASAKAHASNPTPLVIAVGPLPPPVHGASSVTLAVWTALRTSVDLVGVDTSAGDRTGARYHVRRIRRHLAAAKAVVVNRKRRLRTLYVTCPAGQAMWYAVVVVAVARACGYRVILHHHSYAYVNQRSTAMSLLVRLCSSESSQLLLCDDMRRGFDQMYHPRGEELVCSNAAWMSTGRAVNDVDAPVILRLGHLGRLTEEKGLSDVLGTFRDLLEAGVDCSLTLAGPLGSVADRGLIAKARAEATDRLHLVGSVAGHEKEQFFASIDVFVFPTRYIHEAEPLVILESLAAGVSVVAYGRGCIGCLVPPGAGLVVDPEDAFEAAAVPYLCTLAGDRDARRAAGRAALETFTSRHVEAAADRQVVLGTIVGMREHRAASGGFGSAHGG